MLQDLASLESAESDPRLRTLAVDTLLADASAYGGEVAARYRGYLLAIGEDHELLDVVASVARLRTPVDSTGLRRGARADTREICAADGNVLPPGRPSLAVRSRQLPPIPY